MAFCTARIGTDPRMPYVRQCRKLAREGSEFCGLHDPEMVAARQAKADAKALKRLRTRTVLTDPR